MNFVNDQFFELTGHPHAPVSQYEWFDLVAKEDVERVKKDWENMLSSGKTNGVQFRLKKTWVNQDGIRSNIWVQSSSFPELDENGKVISTRASVCTLHIARANSCRHHGNLIRHITVQMGRKCPATSYRRGARSQKTTRKVCHCALPA